MATPIVEPMDLANWVSEVTTPSWFILTAFWAANVNTGIADRSAGGKICEMTVKMVEVSTPRPGPAARGTR